MSTILLARRLLIISGRLVMDAVLFSTRLECEVQHDDKIILLQHVISAG